MQLNSDVMQMRAKVRAAKERQEREEEERRREEEEAEQRKQQQELERLREANLRVLAEARRARQEAALGLQQQAHESAGPDAKQQQQLASAARRFQKLDQHSPARPSGVAKDP
jgi:hypothetical protein